MSAFGTVRYQRLVRSVGDDVLQRLVAVLTMKVDGEPGNGPTRRDQPHSARYSQCDYARYHAEVVSGAEDSRMPPWQCHGLKD